MKFRDFAGVCAVAVLGLLLFSASQAKAEEEEEEKTFSFSADLDFASKYMWRGAKLNDDLSIQPGFSASAYGFTAALWFQIATDSVDDRTLEEVDLTLSYEKTFGKVTASGGLIRYMYPDVDGAATNELFVTAAYEHQFAPSVGFFYDLDLETFYLEANAGPTFEAMPKLELTPNLTASYYDLNGDSSTRLEPAVDASYDIGSGISASAKVSYALLLSPDEAKNQFWAAAGLHYSF